jgi:hypothetical protein
MIQGSTTDLVARPVKLRNSAILTSTMFTSEVANVAFAGKVLVLVRYETMADFRVSNKQLANRFGRKRRTTRRRPAYRKLDPQPPGVFGRFLSCSSYWRTRKWSPGCFYPT